MIDIKVPTVGESISEVSLVKWLKKDGEYVERDEMIAELESEKATFEVNAVGVNNEATAASPAKENTVAQDGIVGTMDDVS